jgi:hypothetical protein
MKRESNLGHLFIESKKGRTTVETIATLLLIILLGMGLMGLTASSVNAYQRLYRGKECSTELRIAYSFITTKIRQNDVTGCLHVVRNPISNQNALVIYETIDGVDYATWIYHYQGTLWEAFVLKEEAPSLEVSQAIAQVDAFTISYDPQAQGIRLQVSIEGHESYGGLIKTRTRMGEEL